MNKPEKKNWSKNENIVLSKGVDECLRHEKYFGLENN